jgi:hypothetical protein
VRRVARLADVRIPSRPVSETTPEKLALDPERPRLHPEPVYRPDERFWPYVDLPEEPTTEELAALDPDLHAALFGSKRPFSITIVFPRFEGPDYERALALAQGADDYREVGLGDAFRSRARFLPSQTAALRDLFQLVERYQGCDVLIDDRPVPYARELWLPLLWYLLPR